MAGEIFLLDSSFVIPSLRRRPPQAIGDRFVELVSARNAAINGLVRLEVLLGCRTEEVLEATRYNLGALRLVETAAETWDAAAQLGFALARQGVGVAIPDLVIAASAIEHSAVLVHADSDFDLIAQHSDLKVESYVGAVRAAI